VTKELFIECCDKLIEIDRHVGNVPSLRLECFHLARVDYISERMEKFHFTNMNEHFRSFTADLSNLTEVTLELDLGIAEHIWMNIQTSIGRNDKLKSVNISRLPSLAGYSFIERFSNLVYLKLRAKHITDASCLGEIYHLDLSGCFRLTNISGLGRKNYYVNLTACHGLTDFNSLGNVVMV
jgi:hypothetical protein